MSYNNRYLRIWRRTIQLAMLALLGQWSFYGIFRCPFPVPYVTCDNCPVITCQGRLFGLFWGVWGLVLFSGLLFGRVFCSWACPGGLLCQLIGKILPYRARWTKEISKMHLGKYVALAVVSYLWLVLDNPRWAVPIRIGQFFESVALTIEHAGTYWLIRTFIVLGILVIGLFFTSAWCRYACPTGGVLELFSRFSLFRVYKSAECNHCGLCQRMCEMHTMPGETNCTNCMDCTGVCPVNAIKIGKGSDGHERPWAG